MKQMRWVWVAVCMVATALLVAGAAFAANTGASGEVPQAVVQPNSDGLATQLPAYPAVQGSGESTNSGQWELFADDGGEDPLCSILGFCRSTTNSGQWELFADDGGEDPLCSILGFCRAQNS